jgi:hypothetical protein
MDVAHSTSKLVALERIVKLTEDRRHAPKGPLPLPRSCEPPQAYNRAVRCYTTSRVNGTITFKCIFCEHTVITRNFDIAKGNCRTQAASAMNRHAAELHSSSLQTPPPAKLGNRGGP